ncbi:MAG: peptidoglycan-binding protein, partial [Paraglaciecola chathamensis]
DQATLDAFKHFQRDHGLAQTGVPDQNTLMNLFLKKSA